MDKSGLIRLINQTIDTPRRLTCVSRPRRFGKSFAAQMLCAYYDKTCDSTGLFDSLEIAGDADIVYLPRKDSVLPALIVGLKWNQSAESALEQIRDRRYPKALEEYGGEILLVRISYDREAMAGKRKHRCRIERYRK